MTATPSTPVRSQFFLIVAVCPAAGGLAVGRATLLHRLVEIGGQGAAVEKIVQDVVKLAGKPCRRLGIMIGWPGVKPGRQR